MNTKSKITEEYFENTLKPDLNEFLDIACEKMFEAYVKKSLQETKKHYIINQTLCRERETIVEEIDETNAICIDDEYNCFFDMMLTKLTSKQKLCIELLYKEGYTEKMISEIMKITPQAVYNIHKCGIKKLRKEMLG